MNFNELLFGKNYYWYKIYDIALANFNNTDFLSNEILYQCSTPTPEGFDAVYEFLEKKGLVVISKHGIRITELGKIKVRTGGFSGANIRRGGLVILGVLASIAGILSLFI